MKRAAQAAGFFFLVLPGLLEAWHLRFIQDDAYISCRYADNLASGLGLVWNEGERVEGYTNFLWTVILSIPHALHLDVETFIVWLGLSLFTATLTTFCVLVRTITRSWCIAATATLMLGLFPSFAAFATGGLETMLQTCLVTVTAAIAATAIHQDRACGLLATALGVAATLAILTRLDSLVIVTPLLAMYVGHHVSTHRWRRLAAVAPVVVVPAVVCGGWLAWKLAYYGSLLPNSFYAKVEELGPLTRQGARYVLTFVQAYAFYLPFACLAVGAWLAVERRLDRRIFILLALPIFLWIGYIVRVGGDFMEYRFFVPALPLLFSATFWIMSVLIAHSIRAALLTACVIAGGMLTYASPKVPKPLGSPLPLRELAIGPTDEWLEIGTVLGNAFPDAVRPRIAVVPAGVIPYRSRLPAVDMLGLNDPDVRSFMRLPAALVGHRRLAPLDVLERRHVNLLIGYPFVRPRLDSGKGYSFGDFAQRPYAYPDERRLKGRWLVEVALSRNRVLLVVYLTEEAAITARIDALGWRRYPLE